MISAFHTANQAVDETIRDLCSKLARTNPTDEDFVILVDAIAKLRASKNSPIIQDPKSE